jgi:hypothetical protein
LVTPNKKILFILYPLSYTYRVLHQLLYRQKLRRLEVALIEYRESLEERGIKNLEEIEKKVLMHRKRLQVEYGLSDSNEDGQGSSKLFHLSLSLESHSEPFFKLTLGWRL